MNLQNQLNFIYNDIDVNMRADTMRRSKEKIIFNKLFIELDEFKFDWWIKVKKLQKEINQDQDNRMQFIIKQRFRYDQNERPFDQYINRQYQRSYQDFNYEQRLFYQNESSRY